MTQESGAAPFDQLATHPHVEALARLVHRSALEAARTRQVDFAAPHRVGREPVTGGDEGLTHDQANTPFGNVVDTLERGAERPSERALLSALLALGIRHDPPSDAEAGALLGVELVWLAAHTPCDALPELDRALDEGIDPIWEGVALPLLEPEHAPPDFGMPEALMAAAALRQSSSRAARALRASAESRIENPVLRALILPGADDASEIRGQLVPPPRGPALTLLLAVTLLLFAAALGRLILRGALGYTRPATLHLGPQGLELSQRIELLGRTLRERSTLIPMSNLASITREVRFARVGLYVGLLTLVLGTYLGTGLLIDGLRVPGGSMPVFGLGALLVGVGLLLDFLFSGISDSARGRCRIVIVPRRGKALCVGAVDARLADALLSEVAERSRKPESEPAPEPTPEPAPT